MLTVGSRRAGRRPVDLGREDPTCTASRHGTASAHRYGCKCPKACEANRLYYKRLRQGRPEIRLIDATGTIRRIRALMALGHTTTTIGEAAGRTSAAVTATANRRRRWVEPAAAAAYRHAYDTLSMTPGTSAKTRGRALAWGWKPPLAWDDDTIDNPEAGPRDPQPRLRGIDHAAVIRAVTGPVDFRLSKPERRIAAQQMTAAGIEKAVIAERLGVSVDAVTQQRVREHRVAA